MKSTQSVAAKNPLAVVPREKAGYAARAWASEIETLGLVVTFEGRGCYVWARAWRGPVDMSGQMNLGELQTFLHGCRAMKAILH